MEVNVHDVEGLVVGRVQHRLHPPHRAFGVQFMSWLHGGFSYVATLLRSELTDEREPAGAVLSAISTPRPTCSGSGHPASGTHLLVQLARAAACPREC